MLNYIWAGLIVSSFVFALGYDVRDIAGDRYRNGQPLPVALAFPEGYDAGRPPRAGGDPDRLRGSTRASTGRRSAPAASYPGYLLQTKEGIQLRFAAGAKLPEPLATIAKVSSSRDEELQGRLVGFTPPAQPRDTAALAAAAGVVFEPVRFVKLNAIAAAALDFAKTGAEIALGLVGRAGALPRAAQDRRARGDRLRAGEAGPAGPPPALSRGAARPSRAGHDRAQPLPPTSSGSATRPPPSASRRWRSCRSSTPSEDTATNPMVMLLAINTASVQLVPPVLLLALLGLQINKLIFPITISTVLSLIVAIVAAKLLGRLRGLPRLRPQPERSGPGRGAARLRPPWRPRATP